MRNTFMGTIVAVMAGTALAAAQAPQGAGQGAPSQPTDRQPTQSRPADPQSSQPRSDSSSSMSGKAAGQTVTYTGCLEEGSVPGTFVLTNASSSAASQSAQNAPGQAGQSSIDGQRIALAGTPSGFDFRANVNHRVTVTGSMASVAGMDRNDTPRVGNTPQANPNPGQPQAGQSEQGQNRSGAQPDSSMAAHSMAQTFTVTTARSLSDRCSAE